MANAVPADASSSASVNPTLIAVEHTSSDTVKLVLSGDVSIVSRFCYFDEPLAIDDLLQNPKQNISIKQVGVS